MIAHNKVRRWGGAVVLLVLVASPLAVSGGTFLDLLVRICLNAVVAIGLNFLMGYAGQISLGHAGFFGVGAYASGILTTRFDWPSGVALLVGACIAALIAFIVARPILRLRGHYLAMATLGLGMIISIILTNETRLTGGADGISVPALSLFGWRVTGDRQWYVLSASILAITVWGAANLISSPPGRALQIIRGSEIAARTVGVNVTRAKVRVFVISAVMASLMGSMYAHYVGFVTPGISGFLRSVEFVIMVVLGGLASIPGSIIGAAVITGLPHLLASLDHWETASYGAILLAVMIFLPRGIVPSFTSILRKVK